jgi:hypothetical protein
MAVKVFWLKANAGHSIANSIMAIFFIRIRLIQQ